MKRRDFFKLVGTIGVVISAESCGFLYDEKGKDLQFLVPSDYVPPKPDNKKYCKKLKIATLDYIKHFAKGENIAQWNKPFAEIDFEKRLDHIIPVLLLKCFPKNYLTIANHYKLRVLRLNGTSRAFLISFL